MAYVGPKFFDDLSDETMVDSSQVRQLFGDRSAMWLTRRARDRDRDRERYGIGFPEPRWIANQRYWMLGELRRYREALPRSRVFASDKPRPVPPPRPPRPSRGAALTVEVKAAASDADSGPTTPKAPIE
jgi:hypothetical protein